tara:strand:+ start:14 stop:1042 length:1029 start_codon:yes stop_codon:yes gene_type:complete
MAIKLTIELIRFLNAAKRLYNQGFMGKEEILDFARREFGEITGVLKTRLDQIFKKPATGIKKQETKKGEVVELKPKKDTKYRSPDEFDNRKEYERYLDEVLGPPDDVFGNPMKDQMLENFDKVKAKNVTPKINEIVAKGVEGEDPDLAKLLRQSDDLDEPVKKPTAKEMTETALNNLIKKRFDRKRLGTISQDANARTAIREFLTRRLEDGTLKIPDEVDRDAIKNFRGNVDPIDVFRKAYGEDAIGVVARIQEEFPDAFRGDSFKEIGDEFERLYKLEAENLGSELPKPKDKYGFDEGLMTDEELEKVLRKDLEEKQMLEDFETVDREPNEAGGIAGILKL